jgi:hypothetical protein
MVDLSWARSPLCVLGYSLLKFGFDGKSANVASWHFATLRCDAPIGSLAGKFRRRHRHHHHERQRRLRIAATLASPASNQSKVCRGLIEGDSNGPALC